LSCSIGTNTSSTRKYILGVKFHISISKFFLIFFLFKLLFVLFISDVIC
jgi:hypothetical protein